MQQQLALQSDSNRPLGFIPAPTPQPGVMILPTPNTINGKSVQSTVDLHQALIPNMGEI